MKVGDLVKIDDYKKTLSLNDGEDERRLGAVLNLDFYWGNDMPHPLRRPEPIVEVLWNTGSSGWILRSRVEVLDESG